MSSSTTGSDAGLLSSTSALSGAGGFTTKSSSGVEVETPGLQGVVSGCRFGSIISRTTDSRRRVLRRFEIWTMNEEFYRSIHTELVELWEEVKEDYGFCFKMPTDRMLQSRDLFERAWGWERFFPVYNPRYLEEFYWRNVKASGAQSETTLGRQPTVFATPGVNLVYLGRKKVTGSLQSGATTGQQHANSACANHNLACADHNLSDATTEQHHANSSCASHDLARADHDLVIADHNLAIILVYLCCEKEAELVSEWKKQRLQYSQKKLNSQKPQKNKMENSQKPQKTMEAEHVSSPPLVQVPKKLNSQKTQKNKMENSQKLQKNKMENSQKPQKMMGAEHVSSPPLLEVPKKLNSQKTQKNKMENSQKPQKTMEAEHVSKCKKQRLQYWQKKQKKMNWKEKQQKKMNWQEKQQKKMNGQKKQQKKNSRKKQKRTRECLLSPEIRLSTRIQKEIISLVLPTEKTPIPIIPPVIYDCINCIMKEAELILEWLRLGFGPYGLHDDLSYGIRNEVLCLIEEYSRADPCAASVASCAVLLGITKESELVCKKLRQDNDIYNDEHTLSLDIRTSALDMLAVGMDQYVLKRAPIDGFCYRIHFDPASADLIWHEKECQHSKAQDTELGKTHVDELIKENHATKNKLEVTVNGITRGSHELIKENHSTKNKLEGDVTVNGITRGSQELSKENHSTRNKLEKDVTVNGITRGSHELIKENHSTKNKLEGNVTVNGITRGSQELSKETHSTKNKLAEDVILYNKTRGASSEGLYPKWTD